MPDFDPRSEPRRLHFKGAQPPGLITRVAAGLVAVGLLVVGFMFSVVVFAVILVVGLVAGSILWWRTRTLRRNLRTFFEENRERAYNHAAGPAGRPGHQPADVIEGEVIREVAPKESRPQ